MFTNMNVLVIVVLTILVTMILTLICFSCVTVSGLEEKLTEAYNRGFSDGEKASK
jgi:hypothetical protein